MSLSIRDFCERLVTATESCGGELNITWTSTLRIPSGSDMPVLRVVGVLKDDRIDFPEKVRFYGTSRKFINMLQSEKVTSSKVTLHPVTGPMIYVESLL